MEEQTSLPAITQSRLLKLHWAHRSPRDLVKNADSDSGGLGRGPRSCMSNELMMLILLVRGPHLSSKYNGTYLSTVPRPL